MAQFTLPKIGDGTGGTVAPGNAQLATAGAAELAEILDHFGKKVAQLTPRKRMLFIAVEAERQLWSFSDSPNTFPAADVDPPGGGGGPHATTHQDGGLDEISVTALSGLLADPQAPLSHAHIIADTTGLQTVLDGKADDAHTHVIADTTGLQAALDGKAPTSHSHAISDTTGLQTALDGKAALTHTHPASDVASGTLDIARIPTGQTGSTVPFGNDARFTDARTPVAHATSHKSGGGDPIKLDELAAPTDITTLDADTSKHGLMKKFPGGTTNFLRADGAFATPPGGGSVTAPFMGDQAPGSFTVVTGQFGLHANGRIKLTTTQRATLQGTGRLRLT